METRDSMWDTKLMTGVKDSNATVEGTSSFSHEKLQATFLLLPRSWERSGSPKAEGPVLHSPAVGQAHTCQTY